MKNSLFILFRVDADEKLGLGHISRCRSLMLAFDDAAFCRFAVVTNNPDLARKVLPQVDVDLYAVADIGLVKHADIAIIDVPNIAHMKEELWNVASLIVVLDDDGHGLQYQDILLRPNLLDLPLPEGMASNDYWSGPEFIILHPDFRKLASQPRNKDKKPIELFVCFGGSDPGGLTLGAIPVLKRIKQNITIQIILGAAFEQGQAVIAMTGDDARFTVKQNVSDMAQRIRQADIALISGGTLLYEACALGTPAAIISQNEPQAIEAAICAAAGAVIYLGDKHTASDEKIMLALQNLLGDAGLRHSMSHKGPQAVSPDGATGIVSGLLLRSKQEAIL